MSEHQFDYEDLLDDLRCRETDWLAARGIGWCGSSAGCGWRSWR